MFKWLVIRHEAPQPTPGWTGSLSPNDEVILGGSKLDFWPLFSIESTCPFHGILIDYPANKSGAQLTQVKRVYYFIRQIHYL